MRSYLFISALFIILSVSCKHKHEDPHAGHSHEDVKIQLAMYNQDYELWTESDPFAAGNTSNILVHVTSLKDFKPAEPLAVTVSLITGSKGIKQRQEHPISSGMFQIELQPETAGDGYLLFEIQTSEGVSRIQSPAVKIYADLHEAQHEVEEQEQKFPNAITFTKEQSWKIDFSTALPIKQDFGQVIKSTAQIQSSQADETVVSARTGGIVLMEGNEVTEGKSVNAGQNLFSISGAGMADNNAGVRFVEAQNNYTRSKADYERAQNLINDKIVSDKEFLSIKSEYETNKAIYDNLRKNFSIDGQRVSSPIAGYIKQVFVSNGQYAEAGQALVSISKNKTLLLRADVQPKYAPLLPFVSSANIRSMDKQYTYSLEELNGKFISFGRSLTGNNYLIPVTFQIDNKAGFIPGGFVEIFIRTTNSKPVLTIPNAALTEEQGLFFVFVQLTPEQFEKREVKVGVTDGIYSEIISGISDNERVVTKGAVSVKLAQSAGALDPHAGHVH